MRSSSKVTKEWLLGLLRGRPHKPLFSHSWATSHFAGCSFAGKRRGPPHIKNWGSQSFMLGPLQFFMWVFFMCFVPIIETGTWSRRCQHWGCFAPKRKRRLETSPKVGVTGGQTTKMWTESPRKGPGMGFGCSYRKPPLEPSFRRRLMHPIPAEAFSRQFTR